MSYCLPRLLLLKKLKLTWEGRMWGQLPHVPLESEDGVCVRPFLPPMDFLRHIVPLFEYVRGILSVRLWTKAAPCTKCAQMCTHVVQSPLSGLRCCPLHSLLTWCLCCLLQPVAMEWCLPVNPIHWPLCPGGLTNDSRAAAWLVWCWALLPTTPLVPTQRGAAAGEGVSGLSRGRSWGFTPAQLRTPGKDWQGHCRPVIFGSKLLPCYMFIQSLSSFIFWSWLQINIKKTLPMILFIFLMTKLHLLCLQKKTYQKAFKTLFLSDISHFVKL